MKVEGDGIEYLCKDTGFAGFVLCYFMDGVFSAVFALAVGTAGLWNVDYVLDIGTERGKDTHGDDRLGLRCLMSVINNLLIPRCDCWCTPTIPALENLRC